MNPLSGTEPWDLVAEGYAAEAVGLMTPFSARALELSGVSTDSEVLDVAAGPGTLTVLAAPRVKRVRAVDFSEQMLAQLAGVLRERELWNVEASVGDGQALGFADASFDAAFSMFGLMFFPDRPRGFRELFRVLKPRGRAVVSSWAPVERSSLMSLMFGAMRAADPSRPAPQQDLLSLENPELFARELSEAGFVDVTIHTHEERFPPVPADELWERMTRSSAPLLLLRRKLGESVWKVQAEAARAYLREALANGDRELSTTAFLGVGHKPA